MRRKEDSMRTLRQRHCAGNDSYCQCSSDDDQDGNDGLGVNK
jgi:hypothetical protein